MKRKWINQFSYDSEKSHKETPKGVSKTIPEMTLSLRELLERYTRGQNIEIFHPTYLGEDDEMPDMSVIGRMTPQERLDLAREIREKIEDYRTSVPQGQLDLEAEIEAQKLEKISKKIEDKTGDEKT